jgi:diphthamide synthase (EF-2-diphthine--ammonia ligase)
MKEQIVLSWSGGKDSTLALYELMKQDKFDITLLTTITDKYKRISIHGVKETLIEKQAESLRCRLEKLYIPRMRQ